MHKIVHAIKSKNDTGTILRRPGGLDSMQNFAMECMSKNFHGFNVT